MGFEDLLSFGAIAKILDGEKPALPVFQIIGFKPIGADQVAFGSSADEQRFRLMMGDGEKAHQYCIITNQDLVKDIRSGKLEKWSIVRLTNYHTVDYGDGPVDNKRRLIYVLNLDVVKRGSEIGSKLTVQNGSNGESKSGMTNQPPAGGAPPANQSHGGNQFNGADQSNYGGHQQSSGGYHPISDPTQARPYNETTPRKTPSSGYEHQTIGIGELTPYIGKWNVMGRVTSKSQLREYSNAKGNGKLFNFSIADKTGEVKVTAFNADCERVFPLIEPNKVYIMGRGTVKHADKRYTSADFEITLNSDSLVEEVTDSGTADIPLAKFNFISIASLATREIVQPVDLMGVITEVSDVSSIMSKTKNKELKKRNIVIVDMSRTSISVTIWGDSADTFNGAVGDVFATKSARISSYGGKSASAGDTCFLNPDIPESRKMKNWYSNLLETNFTSLTSSQESGGSNEQHKNLAELKNMSIVRNITSSGSVGGMYAKCAASILSIGKNPVYKCCPADGCGKKLVDMQNGEMKCDKCAQTYSNYRYRYKVDVEIADKTDHTWVTLWDNKAEDLLKMKPDDLERLMKMESKEEYERTISSCNFNTYIFTLRSRIETYNNEEKVKILVVNISPVDPVTLAKERITQIKALAARSAPMVAQ